MAPLMARNTIAYLRRQNVTFIEPDMWPPISPDLNPVDYAIWGPCRSACTMVESLRMEQLKQAIVLEWRALSQRFIDGSINQWRRRLQGVVVVQENGGHTEHKFN